MAAFAPPVRRDNFLYSSVLYADAGNQNHHPRATIAELTALLRPEVPKKPKSSQTPEVVKDQVGHWYTAQLIHYGLSPTKDKNAAKVRLLKALNEGKLEVPGWVTKLESELKKEWEAENRKLKKASVPKTAAAAQSAAAKKSVTPAALPKPTQTKRKREDTEKPKQEEGNKKPKSSSTTSKPPTSSASKKDPVKKSSAALAEEDPWPASTKNIIAHQGPYFCDGDPWKDTRPSAAPSCHVYRISCPDVEADWPQNFIDEFSLAFSASETEWWSRFSWGNFQGIIILERIPQRVSKAIGVPFKWRAHHHSPSEDGEGTGKIFFTSKTTFKGEFHAFFRPESCLFRGEAISNAIIPPRQNPFSTPVLDRIRVEWAEMPVVMRDAPAAKKVRVKKENIKAEPASQSPTPTNANTKKPRIKKEVSNSPLPPQRTPSASQNNVRYDEAQDITFTGTYNMTCPAISDMFSTFPPRDLHLSLLLDEVRDVWWASFSWYSWECVIQMNPGPSYQTLGQPCTLGWRLRDTDSGELYFGRGKTGTITFHEDTTIVGKLMNVPFLGELEFWGKRIPGPRYVGRSGNGFQFEWDGFVNAAYKR